MKYKPDLEISISCFCSNAREIALMLSKDHPFYAQFFQSAANYAQRISTYLGVHGKMPPPVRTAPAELKQAELKHPSKRLR